MSSRIPWGKIGELAANVALLVLGAVLADRQRPAAPAQPTPTPAPRPRAPDASFPKRADNDITAAGHAGVDRKFPPQQPLPAHVGGYRTPPADATPPAPLPGSALRGDVPPDPDPTEPEPPSAPFGPRDMQ